MYKQATFLSYNIKGNMKKISILIPCFNEVGNVEPISNDIAEMFNNELKNYKYEIVFIDNDSNDGTKEKIREICKKNKKVKAIFNIRNFGAFNSPYYGLMQTDGDCTIMMACDYQDPLYLIPEFIKEWENGYKIVVGVKDRSKENPIIYLLRTIYYNTLKKLSNVNIIRHFTGFGLYDKEFIDILRRIDDSTPFLRGVVAEYGYDIKEIPFEQPLRKSGTTHHNLSGLYDAAMLSFTAYTTLGLRIVTITGFVIGIISFIIGLIYLIYKLIHWYTFNAGMAPILVGMFFLGGVVLITLGLIGEYVISINRRSMHRPLVVEKERINFKNE